MADWLGLSLPKVVLFHELKSHLAKLAVNYGHGRGMDLAVVCRRWLLQVWESQLLNIHEFCEPVVEPLVA